jgi:hypothetical protein
MEIKFTAQLTNLFKYLWKIPFLVLRDKVHDKNKFVTQILYRKFHDKHFLLSCRLYSGGVTNGVFW